MKEFYNLKAVITHGVLLDQAFAHCPIFLTADFQKKSSPCLSSSVVDRSYKPTKDRWLE